MFSVVIPLYNKEVSIKKTIQSVLDQTCQDFEIVIINDGSTDNSIKAVEAINDSRIRLIHQENQGVSAARNRGIKEAKYEWIAFLDGDDLWEPNHLEEVKNMQMKFYNAKVFATSFKLSDEKILFKHDRQEEVFKIENYFKEAQKEYIVWTSATVVHKSCFDVVSMFNEKLNRGEDRDLWARLATYYDIVKSKTTTAIYSKDDENSLTNKKALYEKSFVSIVDLQGKYGDERKYYKKIILNRMKSQIKNFNFKEVFVIFFKHNWQLIK